MRNDERQADADIEVTEEMLRAGVAALLDCDSRVDSYETIVTEVYEAMEKIRVKAPSTAPCVILERL